VRIPPERPSPWRAIVGASTSLALLAPLAGALVASGRQMGRPQAFTLRSVLVWIDAHPVSAIFAGVVVLATVVVAYLAVSAISVLLASIARLGRLPRLARVADALATPFVRRTLVGVIGVGLAVSTADPPAPAHAVAVAAPSPETPDTVDSTPVEHPASATMRLLAPAPASAPPEERAPSVPPTDSWTITAGDHLWGLSAAALSTAWGRSPTDAEVLGYVAAVVALNADRFVVAGQPDLVFPGQVFARPPIPSR
jgi:hypothetical protein